MNAAASTITRTFLPSDDNPSNAGRNVGVRLTIDERNVLTYGRESNAVEFFDARSKRDVRAVMGSNRAPFLS
jgi:hypothetical protein